MQMRAGQGCCSGGGCSFYRRYFVSYIFFLLQFSENANANRHLKFENPKHSSILDPLRSTMKPKIPSKQLRIVLLM